jgi:hypothetical protein
MNPLITRDVAITLLIGRAIDPRIFSTVCGALIASDAKTATKYLLSNVVVRATWHNKPHSKNTRETMIVSYGNPNYLERNFVRACKKAGEVFPVKKIQFRPWPKKVAKKGKA